MFWYEALIPAAVIALAVRYEARLFLPYWSWIQLVPQTGSVDTPRERRRKRQSLARRVAIPLIVGLALVGFLPGTYGLNEVVVVALLGAGLLLWPLLFAHVAYSIPTSNWKTRMLYGLVPVSFAAAGLVGGWIAQLVAAQGGWLDFIQDQFISIVITTIVLLFANAAIDRLSAEVGRDFEEEIATSYDEFQ